MKNKLSVISALCAMFCMIFASDTVIKYSADALRLCIEVIVPSLLPFVAVTSLLRRLGFMQWLGIRLQKIAAALFGCSGEGTSALVMGLLGGYPLGASEISSMLEQKRISSGEAERLLAFCNNSGPAFIVGTVGAGVFGSVSKGILLYLIHVLSAVLCGILFRRKNHICNLSEYSPISVSFSAAFTDSVKEALSVGLNVCGFVICFTVLSAILRLCGVYSLISSFIHTLMGIDEDMVCALLTGVLEIGSGAGALAGLPDSAGVFCSAAFILGFGGLSVHAQTAALFADSGISMKRHFSGKLLCGCISAALAFVLEISILK